MFVKCFRSSPICHSGSKSSIYGALVARCWEQITGSTQKITCASVTPFTINLTQTSPLLNPPSVVRRQRITNRLNHFMALHLQFILHYIQKSISTSHRTILSFYNMHHVIQFMDTIFILCKICRNSTRKTWQNTDL